MKRFFSVITIIGMSFFISCVKNNGNDIYGDVNDHAAEESDNEIPDYQTKPDGDNLEINDSQNDEILSDFDSEIDDDEVDTTGMILIPQGKAWIGCNENIETDCPEIELPYYEIYSKAYFIDKYEVTVADFQKCINNGACGEEGDFYNTKTGDPYCNLGTNKTNHPINCVSWLAANAYCLWVGKRLPSEGEWEKAARGGCEIHGNDDCEKNSYIYTWGNEGTPDCTKVNMAKSASETGCGKYSTSIGGSYSGGNSPYGVSDMLGNLFEWVADSWSENHQNAKPDGSSNGIPNGEGIIKGGGFTQENPFQFRVSYRSRQYTEEIVSSRGFRCVADIK